MKYKDEEILITESTGAPVYHKKAKVYYSLDGTVFNDLSLKRNLTHVSLSLGAISPKTILESSDVRRIMLSQMGYANLGDLEDVLTSSAFDDLVAELGRKYELEKK